MLKKITIKRIFHRDQWRYGVFFKNDTELKALVRLIKGMTWSQTYKCWYAGDDEATLKQILATFRDNTDIDISSIVTGEKQDKQVSLSVVKPVKESEPLFPVTIHEIISSSEPDQDKKPEVSERKHFDPVQFTINEPDGKLAIKFTGRYNKEWIEEMKSYGRIYYDASRMEWLLRWSQMTVDSLADYFALNGIKVIVKKKEIPFVLKGLRDEQGSEIRDRELKGGALDGIDKVKRYLTEKRYSINTVESYTSQLEIFFKYFYDKDPLEITMEDISYFFHDHVVRLGYSSSYQNQIISAIKIYYNLFGRDALNSEFLERPRRSRALPKVFSKEEVKLILNSPRNPKHKLLLWMIYSCGLRRSEITNIKVIDLDRERGILNIREAKGMVDRVVPVSAKVWEKIEEYIVNFKPSVYLFEGQTGGRYSVESVYHVFKQAVVRAGIKKDVGVHSLRHSYATHLHENGLDIRYIQELLGHKSTRTTEIYTHVSRRNLVSVRSPIEDIDVK